MYVCVCVSLKSNLLDKTVTNTAKFIRKDADQISQYSNN